MTGAERNFLRRPSCSVCPFNSKEVIFIQSIYDGLTCPVCHARFFEDEDIVYCPVCGAPHHRDCWNHTGHCAHEEAHGTDRQWQMPEEASAKEPARDIPGGEPPRDRVGHACPQCGRLSTSDTLFCPYCGHAFGGAAPQGGTPFSPFAPPVVDPFGGVDPAGTIDDRPVQEVASMVAVNTPWYLPRFDRFSRSKNKKKIAWNWVAFLFPSYWLFWRKCYGAGAIALSASIASRLLSYPLMAAVNALIPAQATYVESRAILSAHLTDIPPSALLLFAGGILLSLACSLFFGMFGTYFYKKRCLHKLEQLHSPDFEGDADAALLRSRGVNLFGPLLAMALLDIAYMLLISFL